MKKTTLIIRGQPAPQGGSHHGWHHPTRPVVIRNMQGEVIARLGEEQGCTDDLDIEKDVILYSTDFLTMNAPELGHTCMHLLCGGDIFQQKYYRYP